MNKWYGFFQRRNAGKFQGVWKNPARKTPWIGGRLWMLEMPKIRSWSFPKLRSDLLVRLEKKLPKYTPNDGPRWWQYHSKSEFFLVKPSLDFQKRSCCDVSLVISVSPSIGMIYRFHGSLWPSQPLEAFHDIICSVQESSHESVSSSPLCLETPKKMTYLPFMNGKKQHITHTITRSVRTLRESKLILTPIHQGSKVVLGSEGQMTTGSIGPEPIQMELWGRLQSYRYHWRILFTPKYAFFWRALLKSLVTGIPSCWIDGGGLGIAQLAWRNWCCSLKKTNEIL